MADQAASMRGNVEIVAYRPEHFGELLSFLRKQYPANPQKAKPAFFQWRFADNPLGSPLDNYQLAIENGRIVGQLGAIRDRIWAKSRWWDCCWLVDLIMAPEHRGPQSSTVPRMFQAVMKKNPLLLATGCGPNQLRFYKALGWHYLEVFGTYYAIRRPGPLLGLAEGAGERRPLLKPFLPLAGLAMTTLQSAHGMWGELRGLRLEFDRLGQFGYETTELIERVLPSLAVTSHRSSMYLNWKFNQRPEGTHFVITARRKGRLGIDGYIAVKIMERRPHARWAEIVDFLAKPRDSLTFKALLHQATKQALELEVDFLRLRCSLEEHWSLLNAPFWIRRDRSVIDGTFFRAQDPELGRYLALEPWHLTSLVSDRADQGTDEYSSELQKAARAQPATPRQADWARHALDKTS